MKIKSLLASLFVFCFAKASPPGFLYYKLLTTQESQINVGNNNLFNYPILVRLTNADLKHTSSGGYVQNINGYDIIFTSSDGNTVIPHQLENYDPVTGTLIAWVQIPILSATVNTDFYLYFGNNSISVDPSSTAVWDLNYKGVYHLNTNRNDFTANGSDLTSFNTSNQSPAIAADGEHITLTQYLTRAPDPNLQIDADLTLETWVRFGAALQTGATENVLFSCAANGATANENYHFYLNYYGGGVDADKLRAYWEYNTKTPVTAAGLLSTVSAAPGIGTWHHITMIRDNTNLVVKFYFDGIQVGANVAYVNPPNFGAGSSFQIGTEYPGSANDINADFDEPRVSNSARSPEYVQATYESTKIGSTFITYGATTCLTLDVANAGPDQNVCSSAATMAANPLTVGSGFWTLVSGTGAATSPTSPTTGITGLSVGANVFKWTVSNGPCSSSSDNVVITRDANPTVSNAGPDFNVCTTSSAFAGNTPAIGTGVWTLVSGTGVPGSPNSPTSAVTGLSVGANVFDWTISNGTCPPSSSQITITRDAPPDISNAGLDQTVCSTTAAMSANTPVIGNGTWSLISGSGTITTFNSPTTTITGLGIGANVFQWSISNGTCPPSTDQVTITRNAPPTTANAGPTQNLCSVFSTSLAGNTPTTGTGTWTLISGSGIPAAPNSPTSAVTGLSLGANIFQWSISNGICPSSASQVTINVDPAPSAANAGPDQTICTTTSIFAGNTPATGTGTWALISGSGIPSTPNSPTSAVTGLGVGANIFQWTITSGGCPPASDQITITRDANPTTANAGPDQTICSSSAAFAGNVPVVGVGIWTLISGSGVPTTPTSATSAVTGLGVGANVFQWTISNGTCTPSQDTMIINVSAFPSTAQAGPDQTICSASTNFSGTTPVNGTGTWSLISGTGTIVSPNSPTSVVNSLSSGQNIFMWTITNGTCPPSRDTVIITRDPLPTTSNAGPDQSVCSTTSIFAANTPIIGTGTWALVSGTGAATSFNSPTSPVTGLSAGLNYFQWIITNGTCPASRDTMIIKVDPLPTPSNAGTDQITCTSSSAFSGNTPTVGNGFWSLVSGTGTITSPASPTSTVTGLTIGQNIFEWVIFSGSCNPSRDTVIITRYPLPTTSNAGPDQFICSGSSSFAANTPTVGVGFWSYVSGGGTITTFNSPTSTVTGLSVGQNIFEWVITNGACNPSRDTVIITVYVPPSVSNAGPDQNICGSSTSFAGNTPSTGTGTWTLVSGTGIPVSINSPTSVVNGLSVGQNVFVWTIINGACPPSRDTVIITHDPLPTTANAGSDQNICSNSTSFAGNFPGIGLGSWSLFSGSGTIVSFNNPTSVVNGLGVGQNVFVWTITNGTCPPSADTMIIIVSSPPTVSSTGPDQNICTSSSTLIGNAPGIGTGLWTVIAGTGTLVSPTSPTTAVNTMSVGQNIFVWTITNGTCPPSRDTVTITRDPLPSQANAGPDFTDCATSVNLNAAAPTTGIGTWSVIQGTGNIISFNSPTSLVVTLSLGINKFVWTVTSGTCNSSTDTVTVTIVGSTTPASAGSDQTVCGPVTTLTALQPTVGTGTWSVIVGAGTFTNPNLFNTTVTGMGPGQNTYRWTVTNNSCPITFDDVNIFVYYNPTTANAGPDKVVVHDYTDLEANTPANGTAVWTLRSGTGTFANATDPLTHVTGLSVGPNVFRWTVSNGNCQDSYDEVTITLKSLTVPNGFSPDGDGVNDNFEVTGLLEYSNVIFEVFNRWGNVVYRNSDYKNDWNGRNQSGAELTEDTYYYILHLTDDLVYKGFVILKRQ